MKGPMNVVQMATVARDEFRACLFRSLRSPTQTVKLGLRTITGDFRGLGDRFGMPIWIVRVHRHRRHRWLLISTGVVREPLPNHPKLILGKRTNGLVGYIASGVAIYRNQPWMNLATFAKGRMAGTTGVLFSKGSVGVVNFRPEVRSDARRNF